jgi:uncharacterized RDD family membrane protein YckC
MKWLEQTLATQASVIAHLHSQSGSQSDSADLALVCSDLELIAWNGQAEQRLALREVKKFSREGLELLVFNASGEALRLPILSAPRAEIDAFFAALKPAIARSRTLPVAAKAVEPAPIAVSEFKLELSPEPAQAAPPVQPPQVVPQAKTVVLEPEKELSFDLGPLMAPASAPAAHVAPTAIAEPATTGEMVFDLGALIVPAVAPKPVPVPKPKVESAPILEPKIEPILEPKIEPEIKAVFAEEAVQAWPEVFAEHIEPAPPVKTAAMQATSPTKQTVQPMPERSSPQQLQASVSSTPAASPTAKVVTPVGRDQASIESKKSEMFDPLLDAPKPKREPPPRAQDFGNGLFMHEQGFKYQLATIGERFVAALVDGVLLGIVSRIIDAMAYGGVRSHAARLENIMTQGPSVSDLAKGEAMLLELEKIKRNLPAEMFQSAIVAAFLTAIATWMYYAFFEAGEKQATPGKIVMKIGVVNTDISRISFMQASRRYAWRVVPLYATITIGFVSLYPQMYGGNGGALAAGITFGIYMIVGALAFIGCHLLAGFTKRRQAVHDLMSQTLVVKA